MEAHEADVPPAAQEGEVGDGFGEFERHGRLRADGEVELTVGPLMGGAQLAAYVRDARQRYAQIDVRGAPDAQGTGVEDVGPYDGAASRTSASPSPSSVSRRIRASTTACRSVYSR